MIGDMVTVMWKEWKEIVAVGGASRSRIQLFFFLAFTGVFLPLPFGSNRVTSPIVVAIWAWLPLTLVTTLIADSFAGERERHTLETLLASRLSDASVLYGKMAAGVGYGWGLAIAGLIVGLVTVNIANRGAGLLFYSSTTLTGALLVSLLSSLLGSAGGVLVSLRAQTARQAQQTLAVGGMLLFFVPVVGFQMLPDDMRESISTWAVQAGTLELMLTGIAVLASIDVVLIVAAKVRFQRSKLTVG